jgi:hypothetical protein
VTYFEVHSCFGLVRSCGSIPKIVELLRCEGQLVLSNSR